MNLNETSTSLYLSWSVPNGTVATEYEIELSPIQCPENNLVFVISEKTDHEISDLRAGTSYNITVKAISPAGNTSSDTVNIKTEEKGEIIIFNKIKHFFIYITSTSTIFPSIVSESD